MNKLFLQCVCGGEGFLIEEDDFSFSQDETITSKEYNISFWKQGFFNKDTLTFRDKLRWCWQIFRKGIPHTDMIILKKEDMQRIYDWIGDTIID